MSSWSVLCWPWLPAQSCGIWLAWSWDPGTIQSSALLSSQKRQNTVWFDESFSTTPQVGFCKVVKNYLFPKPLAIVVVSELLALKPEAVGTILQCNFWYVADLWKITNTAETCERALGQMEQCQSNCCRVDMILLLHASMTEPMTDANPGSRKEKAICATSARRPYGKFQTHYCLMTACRLGHQCGFNWNWSFTDFWITSWHGLRGA